MSLKQDRTGTRTSEDLRRRINIKGIDEAVKETDINNKTVKEMETRVNGMSESLDNTRKNYVSTQTQKFTEEQKARARNNIGAGNSSFSGSYNDLQDVPTNLVKDSNYVHTDNNFSNSYKNNVDANSSNRHAHSNKSVLDGITAEKIEIWDLAGQSETYFASSYAEDGVTVLRGNIEVKNNRVCFNFVGTKSIQANVTTTLFTLPSNLRPPETRDFVCFGQSSEDDGYIGYGYITSDGLLQVRFSTAITSYIRFSFVYDIIKESDINDSN